MPSDKDDVYSIIKYDCVFCNPSNLIKKSVVTKGNYINNEKFHKAEDKFFNYYISSSKSKISENLNNTAEEKEASYELSPFNPYS